MQGSFLRNLYHLILGWYQKAWSSKEGCRNQIEAITVLFKSWCAASGQALWYNIFKVCVTLIDSRLIRNYSWYRDIPGLHHIHRDHAAHGKLLIQDTEHQWWPRVRLPPILPQTSSYQEGRNLRFRDICASICSSWWMLRWPYRAISRHDPVEAGVCSVYFQLQVRVNVNRYHIISQILEVQWTLQEGHPGQVNQSSQITFQCTLLCSTWSMRQKLLLIHWWTAVSLFWS